METSASRQASRRSGASDSELEQRRQMALRHVRQYPDPVLRRVADPVTSFDDELRQLAERMWSIMDDAWGVGLAAPQIGLLIRMFTWREEPGDTPQALINPRVVASSDESGIDEEGCLSLGDLRISVSRPLAVTIVGQGLDGTEVQIDADGFLARVLQHEIDHLDGVLMFERAIDEAARAEAMRYLRPRA